MMMDEINNEIRYSPLPVEQFLYVAFAFLVIILLCSVLNHDRHQLVRRRQERASSHGLLVEPAQLCRRDRRDKEHWELDQEVLPPGGSGAAGEPRSVRETLDGEAITISDEKLGDVDGFQNAWKGLMNLFDPNLYESYDGLGASYLCDSRRSCLLYPSGS